MTSVKIAVDNCRRKFAGDPAKRFSLAEDYAGESAGLKYMQVLFAASSPCVIVYSSNTDDTEGFEGSHVRHRVCTDWIREKAPEWQLLHHETGAFADFYYL